MSDEPIDYVPIALMKRLEKDKNDEETRRRFVEKQNLEMKTLIAQLAMPYSQVYTELLKRFEMFHQRAQEIMKNEAGFT
jgi:hypothetical protein